MKRNLLFVLIVEIRLKNVFVYVPIVVNAINVNVRYLTQLLAVRKVSEERSD